MQRRRWLAGIAAGAAGALLPPARAATHPMRVLVPFPPGGASDVMARALSASLARTLGRAVVVENVDGAEAARAILQSAPVGSALLLGSTGSIVVDPLVKAGRPVDTMAGLAPVSLLGSAPQVLTAHPSLPVERLDDLVAYLRAHPDQVTYGSPGQGTVPHMAGLLFVKRTGVKVRFRIYQGTGASLAAHTRGECQISIDSQAIGLARSGALRPIAVMSNARLDALPRVPTVSEAGVPGIDMRTWFALFGPAGTPEAERERWAAQVREAAVDPSVVGRPDDGLVVRPGSPEQLGRFVVAETERWSRYLRELGLIPPDAKKG